MTASNELIKGIIPSPGSPALTGSQQAHFTVKCLRPLNIAFYYRLLNGQTYSRQTISII